MERNLRKERVGVVVSNLSKTVRWRLTQIIERAK